MMDRRRFLGAGAALAAAWPVFAHADGPRRGGTLKCIAPEPASFEVKTTLVPSGRPTPLKVLGAMFRCTMKLTPTSVVKFTGTSPPVESWKVCWVALMTV